MHFDKALLRKGRVGDYPISIIPSADPCYFQHHLRYNITTDCYYENEETSDFAQCFTSLCSSTTNLKRRESKNGKKSYSLTSPPSSAGNIQWTFNYSNAFVIHEAKIKLQSESDDAGGAITTVRSLEGGKAKTVFGFSGDRESKKYCIVEPMDITDHVADLHGFVLTVDLQHELSSHLFPSTVIHPPYYSFEVSVVLSLDPSLQPLPALSGLKLDDTAADIKVRRPNPKTMQDNVVCRIHSKVLRECWKNYYRDDISDSIDIVYTSEAVIFAAMKFMYTGEIYGVEDEDQFWDLLKLASHDHFDILKVYCEYVMRRFVTKENWKEVVEKATLLNANQLMLYANSFQLWVTSQESPQDPAAKKSVPGGLLRKKIAFL